MVWSAPADGILSQVGSSKLGLVDVKSSKESLIYTRKAQEEERQRQLLLRKKTDTESARDTMKQLEDEIFGGISKPS